MDTKLKSYKRNQITWFTITGLFLAAAAVIVIASYTLILENAGISDKRIERQKEIEAADQAKREFMEELWRGNYCLYWDIFKLIDGSGITPAGTYLTDSEYFNQIRQGKLASIQDKLLNEESFINEFNEVVRRWHDKFLTLTVNDYNLEYFIRDNKTMRSLTNADDTLVPLLQDTQWIKDYKASLPFYMEIVYDRNGVITIPEFFGLEDSYKSGFLMLELEKNLFHEEIAYDNTYNSGIKYPSDITIIYVSRTDNFNNGAIEYKNPQWEKALFDDGGFRYSYPVAVVLICFIGLILPVKKFLKFGNCFIWKIPFEVIFLFFSIIFSAYPSLLDMAYKTAAGTFINSNSSAIDERFEYLLVYGLNFIIWMAVFAAWLMIIIALRQVFFTGLKAYLKERVLFTSLLYRIFRAIKRFLHSLSEIDLTASSSKSILGIILVNFIVLLICCFLRPFGILGLILYSFAVFILLSRYFNRTKKKYSILMNAASMMAKGNLEASLEEDIGIFEPLKQELAKVRFGFKKAVEKEMKSQEMKSELITNVSHDLKTPLTAIITYVNLLKEPDLAEEEKNFYIATIDKKSQRLKILIEDLFEISKATSNNVTLNLVKIDLSALIKQVLLELEDKIASSGIEFRINLPADKVMLILDSEKTYRIFENLIVNITKFAMPNSRAYIDVEQQEEDVRVIVKNTSSEELDFNPDEIIERFARGDKSRNTEGSGLGLAIVKSFVELQGGTFQIVLDGDLFKTVIEWKRKWNNKNI